jgi:transposase
MQYICHNDAIGSILAVYNLSEMIQILYNIMRPLTSSQKDNVLALLQTSASTREISAQTGVSKSKVASLAKEAFPDKENLPAGCPRKLSSTDEHAVVQQITTGKATNAAQVARNMNSILSQPVTTQTIRNTLHRAGANVTKQKKKPKLTPAQKKACLAFAYKYKEWTVEDWKRVIWSDETKINLYGSDGQQYVWGRRRESLGERGVQKTVKFGGGNIMVWGCMGWNGVGNLVEVEGRMNGQQYVDILDDNLLESMEGLSIDPEIAIFQQDNDPKHTSKVATKWFNDHNINCMDWPAQSPDLNPIEHLWTTLKQKLNDYNTPPSGVWELWERAAEKWIEIAEDDCQKLIRSMPRRLHAVIKAKGGHTKY